MELFDSHCHIDVTEFDADRDAVLQRSRAAGVTRMLVPAVTAITWQSLLDLCRREPDLYPALGLHPIYLDDHRPEHITTLKSLLTQQRPVAVGEIGLDYFVQTLDRQRQQELFEAQLKLAAEFELPVILHVRKSHDTVLATLRRIKVPGGIVHAFNGSLPQADQYQALGFKFGFGGTLTYERSTTIRQLARDLPLESIVLETDAPDMAVAAHRGERNSPEYLPDCLAALAAVRRENQEVIARETTGNACQVLRLPKV
ncbi:MAG: TatD family hydrolase [Gammaproteobacteria bacterium]|nr:TatD family hydrolase [Gammaproteobacteria bacterium]